MRKTRIFHPYALRDDVEVRLADTATHHLTRVLRMRDGDDLILFDGSGREWPATLVDSAHGRAQTGSGVDRDTESPLDLVLVQGISRGERMDWTIQKAVELGVSRITPVVTARTGVKLDAGRAAKRLDHWRGIIIAACEQSGRTRLPMLDTPRTLGAYLDEAAGTVLVLDHSAQRPLDRGADGHGGVIDILVGPEGGLDDSELAHAESAGCVPVHLGPRVMRTETAGVVAIAVLQALYGDLSA